MDRKLSKRITILNLLMTCIIAIYHFDNAAISSLNAIDAQASKLISEGIELFASLAMNWFFTLTGFLLFNGYIPKKYPDKIKRRFFTVFIPYLLWQLAFLLKDLISGVSSNLPNLVRTVFLLKVDPPNGPLWYMSAIFYLALLSPLFYPLLKNKKHGIVTVLIITACSYFICTTTLPFLSIIGQYGRLHNVFSYLGSYVTGLYLGLHVSNIGLRGVWPMLISQILTGLTLEPLLDGFFPFVLKKLVPVLLLYIFPVIENERFCKYASGSFLIYALHAATKWGRITRIRRIFLIPISKAAWFLNLFSRLGALVFTVGVALILWLLSSLFCPTILRLFTGGRVKPLLKSLKKHKSFTPDREP